jgi:hypothetical protein
MPALDAYFGRVFNNGVELELQGGFDFVGLTVTPDNARKVNVIAPLSTVLFAAGDGSGYDCGDLPLHNFHDYERAISSIGTGASLVTVWSHALASLVSANGKIRRFGVRVTFRNSGSGVADIRDLEFEIERAGGSYYLHNVTADTVGAADSAITSMVTGRRSGISINWSLGFDGTDLVFQVLQTGTDRDVGVVVWWDEERG